MMWAKEDLFQKASILFKPTLCLICIGEKGSTTSSWQLIKQISFARAQTLLSQVFAAWHQHPFIWLALTMIVLRSRKELSIHWSRDGSVFENGIKNRNYTFHLRPLIFRMQAVLPLMLPNNWYSEVCCLWQWRKNKAIRLSSYQCNVNYVKTSLSFSFLCLPG